MNDEFINNALAYGKKGEKWLKHIPEIIKRYEEKSSVQVLPPFTLSYNYVAPVLRKDDTKAVIKIGMPWEKEFFNEIEALKVFNGDGITTLLDYDKDDAVMLIELIEPGTPLSTIEDDDTTTRVLAAVMQKIWKPLPNHHTFITVYDWTRELREYVQKRNNTTIPLELADEAVTLFTYLINSSTTPVLTHADLHHDNVLSSHNDWVAIDPKGIVAEPTYDTAALIRNPYKKLRNMPDKDIDRLLKNRILILSEALHLDPKRIHQWCLAQTILSGVWTRDNKEYTDFALKVAHSLKRIAF